MSIRKKQHFKQLPASAKLKISIGQKAGLVLFGIFLACLVLEIGLRLGSFVLFLCRDYENQLALKHKSEYRIMCVGESTTFSGTPFGGMAYPQLLNEILNNRKTGKKFVVINQGVPGINTSGILSQLEEKLDKYKPDMVIAMMGVNDDGAYMPKEYLVDSPAPLFPASLKTYKLLKFIWLALVNKLEALSVFRKATIALSEPVIIANKPQSRESEKGAITQVFADAMPEQADYPGESAFAPDCVDEGFIKTSQGDLTGAEKLFREAIGRNPRDSRAYVGLAWVYRHRGRGYRAVSTFKKAIESEPENIRAWEGLGLMYLLLNDLKNAREVFNKIITMSPENVSAYVNLGWIYQYQGNNALAEEQLQKAAALNPSDRVCGQLATIYLQSGKDNLARQWFSRTSALRPNGFYCLATEHNYFRMKEILDRRKIRLVCAQYPVRSVEPLRKLFIRNPDVILVDNEIIFKKALREGRINEYFIDLFAGDFGHCTTKGNRLLAENIADVILKKVFHQ